MVYQIGGVSEDIVGPDGRLLPTYRPKRPKPRRDKPPPGWLAFLLGGVPGLRLALLHDARVGAPIVAVGVLLIVGLILQLVELLGAPSRLAALGIAPRFVAWPAAGLLILLSAFELLRTAAALSEPRPGARWARLLAGAFLPAAGLAVFSVLFGALRPRWLEPAMVSATVLALGALPAAVYGALRFSTLHQRHRQISAGLLALLILGGGLGLWLGRAPLSTQLKSQGFVVLPRLLLPAAAPTKNKANAKAKAKAATAEPPKADPPQR